MDDNRMQGIFKELARKRKNVGLLLESESGQFDRWWQSQSLTNIELLNIIDDLLGGIVEQPNAHLGAFHESDLYEWLMEGTSQLTTGTWMICSHLDAWLATIGKSKAIEYYSLAAARDFECPILLVTAQRQLVQRSSFPKERIWDIEGKEEA